MRTTKMLAAGLGAALALGACGFGVRSYGGFKGAIEAGAPCAELIAIASRFEGTEDERRVARDLRRLGCLEGDR